MTIKVRQKMKLAGKSLEVDVYLPQEELLTNKKREEADKLDSNLKKEINKINSEYNHLESNFQNTKDKWYWLGKQLDSLINNLSFKQDDIDSNIIWLAINQYLHEELKRTDRKRSGTSQDHLNKCWLLFKTKNHKWIRTWAGWDALTERGNQLLNEKLLYELSKQFPENLNTRDYQFIFKEVTRFIPTLKNRKEIFLMSDEDLKDIVSKIRTEFNKINK